MVRALWPMFLANFSYTTQYCNYSHHMISEHPKTVLASGTDVSRWREWPQVRKLPSHCSTAPGKGYVVPMEKNTECVIRECLQKAWIWLHSCSYQIRQYYIIKVLLMTGHFSWDDKHSNTSHNALRGGGAVDSGLLHPHTGSLFFSSWLLF